MKTFTSSLPEDLLALLAEKAETYAIPKNKLIERALRAYLDQMNKAAYLKSYKRMQNDDDVLAVAEEGMNEYYKQLEDEEG